jgi:hypothetical protein
MKDDKWISNDEAIKTLEKEFVTFKIAQKMYEFGFDEPCFAFYSSSFAKIKAKLIIGSIVKCQDQYHGQICSAPLWQQAIDWLKRKHAKISDEKYIGYDNIEGAIIEALNAIENKQ